MEHSVLPLDCGTWMRFKTAYSVLSDRALTVKTVEVESLGIYISLGHMALIMVMAVYCHWGHLSIFELVTPLSPLHQARN